ncbi:MAG: hypothetical protein HQ564_10375 [Candidatus Saganbacteria bacterium]|nr:hypothetical protein [Candidatus Saganbacteria bacterium]
MKKELIKYNIPGLIVFAGDSAYGAICSTGGGLGETCFPGVTAGACSGGDTVAEDNCASGPSATNDCFPTGGSGAA